MHPYQQQQPQGPYSQQQKSRGFNPPPQQPYPSYPQAAPQAPGYPQHYQNYQQYQQQRPAQYYQQQSQQQRHVLQPPVKPPPTPQQPYPPLKHTPAYPSYAPSPLHAQARPGPEVSPVRANSQSPDKSRRPLPAPVTAARQRPTSMPPAPATTSGYISQVRPQGPLEPLRTAAYTRTPTQPPASSFFPRPAAQSFSQGQSLQAQAQAPYPPHPQPYPPSSMPSSHPSPFSPAPTAPARSRESPTTPSKRPLPAPPGEGAVPSPPVAPGRSAVAVATPADVTDTPSLAHRRTLPFSPTQPPSAEAGIISQRGSVAQPRRSFTLPSSPSPGEQVTNGVQLSGTSDDTSHAGANRGELTNGVQRGGFVKETLSPLPSSQPAPTPSPSHAAPETSPHRHFSPRPPQKQPAQSLAFRIASLSLQEEQAQKQPQKRTVASSVSLPSRRAVAGALPARPASSLPTRPTVSPVRSHASTILDLDDTPPKSSIRQSPNGSERTRTTPSRPAVPTIKALVPTINFPEDSEDDDENEEDADSVSVPVTPAPSISVSEPPSIFVSKVPSISSPETPSDNTSQAPSITLSEATPTISVSHVPLPSTSSIPAIPNIIVADLEGTLDTSVNRLVSKRKGLICYGCGKGIVGRIVSAMSGRWHPACFKCTVCGELLEHVSSYEHDGKPYCHLDYHEKFAPYCYHCRTPIIDERFITFDDPALGQRTYHEQHFFCAECGDPFLAPTIPGAKRAEGDESGVMMQDDDVGFTVYKGHPYCEACHVRLRYPRCKRCKKSIRDGVQAVEALGGKWCWECFLCAGCDKPFDDPAFFQRNNKAYCESCFSIIIKSEM